MKHKKYLGYLLVYFGIAVLFNVVSLVRHEMDLPLLINGNPWMSINLLCLFVVLYLFGKYQLQLAFVVLSVIALITLPIRAIVPHIKAIMTHSYSAYSSELIPWIAAAINLFGFAVVSMCLIKFISTKIGSKHATR